MDQAILDNLDSLQQQLMSSHPLCAAIYRGDIRFTLKELNSVKWNKSDVVAISEALADELGILDLPMIDRDNNQFEYINLFMEYGHIVGQALHDDETIADMKERYKEAKKNVTHEEWNKYHGNLARRRFNFKHK